MKNLNDQRSSLRSLVVCLSRAAKVSVTRWNLKEGKFDPRRSPPGLRHNGLLAVVSSKLFNEYYIVHYLIYHTVIFVYSPTP